MSFGFGWFAIVVDFVWGWYNIDFHGLGLSSCLVVGLWFGLGWVWWLPRFLICGCGFGFGVAGVFRGFWGLGGFGGFAVIVGFVI